MTLAQEVRKQESGDTILALATVTHPDLAAPIYACNNGVDFVSNGHTFLASGWQMQMPDEGEDADNEIVIVIDNVDTDIVGILKTSPIPPTLKIEIVMASAPNSAETTVQNYALADVTFDGAKITGRLTMPLLREEPGPWQSFIPKTFPGLI